MSTGAVIDVEKERRREKAKEMQDKLLKEFAKKQKKFLGLEKIELRIWFGTDVLYFISFQKVPRLKWIFLTGRVKVILFFLKYDDKHVPISVNN